MENIEEALLTSIKTIVSLQSHDLLDAELHKYQQWYNTENQYKFQISSFQIKNYDIDKLNWKMIFLSKLFKEIDRLLGSDKFGTWMPLIRLVSESFGKLTISSYIEEPVIFKYAMECMMRLINLEGDPKGNENLMHHISLNFTDGKSKIKHLTEAHQSFILERFQIEIFRKQFKDYSENFDVDLNSALENTYFANFLPQGSKGILSGRNIILPKKWSRDNNKAKCAMFLAFMENFWELLKELKESKVEISIPTKRERDNNQDSIIKILFGRPVNYITDESANYLMSVNLPIEIEIFSLLFWQNYLDFKVESTNHIVYDSSKLSRKNLWKLTKNFNYILKGNIKRRCCFIEIYHTCIQSYNTLLNSSNFIKHKQMFFALCLMLTKELETISKDEASSLNDFRNIDFNQFWEKIKCNKNTKLEKPLNFLRCYLYDYFIRHIKVRRNHSFISNEFLFATNLSTKYLHLIKELTVDEKEKIKNIFYTDFIQNKLGISNRNAYESLVIEILENTFVFPLDDNSPKGRVLLDGHVIINNLEWIIDKEVRLSGIIYSLINCFSTFASFKAEFSIIERLKLINSNNRTLELPFIDKNIAQFMLQPENYDENFDFNLELIHNSLRSNEDIIWIQFLKDSAVEVKINQISNTLIPILKEFWSQRWEKIKPQIEALSQEFTKINNDFQIRFPDEYYYLETARNHSWNSAYLCFLVHIPKMMIKILNLGVDADKVIQQYNPFFEKLGLTTVLALWEDLSNKNWSIQSLILDFFYGIVIQTWEASKPEFDFYFSLSKKVWCELGLAKLREETKTRIKKFMEIETIKECYKEVTGKNFENDTYINILEEALENTFLIDFPKSNYGRTTINDIIFISSFSEEDDLDLQDGAILVTFVHEFSHLLGRHDLNSLLKKFEYDTPENKHSVSINRRECGYKVEKYVFGNVVDFITIGASSYLFSIDKITALNSFQENFLIENNKTGQKKIGLSRKGNEESGVIWFGPHEHHVKVTDFILKYKSSF